MEQRVTLSELGLSDTVVVTKVKALLEWVDSFLRHPSAPLAFDIETTGLDPRTGRIISLQFYQEGTPVVVVDAREQGDAFAAALKPLFSGKLLILGHNLKFDFLWLMQHYGIFPTRCYDSYLAEQVIHGVGRSEAIAAGVPLGLAALSQHYAGKSMSKSERNWFIDLDQRPEEWEAPLPSEQIAYAAEDVRVLPIIYREQVEQLTHLSLLRPARLEMDTLPAVTSIELSGVRVDVAGWRAFIAEKEQEAKGIEEQALEVFGGAILSARAKVYDAKLAEYQAWEQARDVFVEELQLQWYGMGDIKGQWGKFKNESMKLWREQHPNPGKPKPDQSLPNLGSPAQLLQAFAQMGIAVNSTASEVLAELEESHPEVKLLLDYRKASKFVQSFGEALLQYALEGRIYPEYVQIGAGTGRMSCTRPNWQQVPSKGDGKKLRSLVVAEPGHKLLTADFSNIELRILADMSGDETMLRLFAEGADLHTYTARMMFGLDETVDVAHVLMPGSDQTYRAVAKVINFGLVYGMSCVKLGRTVKVSKERAEELMNAYFRLYPTVSRWMEAQKTFGVTKLFSITRSGRKRFYEIPTDPRDPDFRMIRARVQRQSMNSPIQGTSADITKQALVNLYRSGILQNGLGYARIVAVVHDEIVLEAKDAYVGVAQNALSVAMGNAARAYLTRVTLPPVEVVVSDHWSKE